MQNNQHAANFFTCITNKKNFLKQNLTYVATYAGYKEFGCHIDADEQQRALNFEVVVSD